MARLAVGLLAALGLTACAVAKAPVDRSRADAAVFAKLVDAHNRVRSNVAASPRLAPLRWSSAAAATALEWAERCRFRHNARRGDLGENLFARSGDEPDGVIVAAAVRSWAEEAADYDYRRNACRAGAVCGHYTQMIWRDTRAIGCALARCSGGSPFGSGAWTLVVCNYDPPGNYVGRKPY